MEAGLVAKKPKEPHFFLFAIGTRPSEQGKGLGSQVMAEGLKIVDQANMPAYLESSKEQNIPFTWALKITSNALDRSAASVGIEITIWDARVS